MALQQAITMKDIAAHFGVSVATVSRAMSNNPHISRDTCRLIQDYAREHNFTPNSLAISLRENKKHPSRLIGVIIPEFTHYYFSSILTGIEREAASRGYRIITALSDEKYDKEVEICQSFESLRVCGVIVSQAKDTMRYEHFARLIQRGLPIVFYDRICTGVDASRVVVDDYRGAYNAVDYLVRTGCRRVAFFGTRLNLEIGKNRHNGYRDALLHHHITPDERMQRFCDNREMAEEIAPELLKMSPRPDAFFTINDDTAIGVLYAAKRMGLRVPDDVSICGFTNGQRAIACDPMLTTVEQRGHEVGREATDILIDKVEKISPLEKVERRVVKTKLVIRGTTKALKESEEQP